jgi:DNA-binding IclR family transcriptional regulator
MSEPRTPTVRSVQRAFAILAALARGSRGVTEIATEARLPKSTVVRLLDTLEAERAVTRGPDARYLLGPGIRALAAAVPAEVDLRARARPELERLAATVGEAVGLSVAEAAVVRYIDQVSPDHEVQVRDWTGTTAPMHAVSSGHVLLAALPTAELRALLPVRLASLTPHTTTRRSALERRLETVRRAGHAWVRDEFAEGISSVAAPVLDARGTTVAAVHVHGPSYRFPRPGTDAAIAASVVRAAQEVSTKIAGG